MHFSQSLVYHWLGLAKAKHEAFIRNQESKLTGCSTRKCLDSVEIFHLDSFQLELDHQSSHSKSFNSVRINHAWCCVLPLASILNAWFRSVQQVAQTQRRLAQLELDLDREQGWIRGGSKADVSTALVLENVDLRSYPEF